MKRTLASNSFHELEMLGSGLTDRLLVQGAEFAYGILDNIDANLIASGSARLSQLVELANLSTILGNLIGNGIVRASDGLFTRAGPHRYQDLRATETNPYASNIEIKVALETNSPKGHLPKEGLYLIVRYILGDKTGTYKLGTRGDVVWIWEIRFGYLEIRDFNISNTEGDSGKTAVVNRYGMNKLRIIYFDRTFCPYGPKSAYWKPFLMLM